MVDAAKAVAKYLQSMASPTTAQNYKDGIAKVTDSPMAKAASAQSQALYAQNTAAAVSSGRMAAALNAVPLQRWKENASNKGAARLASGAQAAQQKMQSHFQTWGPRYDQVSQAVAALPKGGVVNAQARSALAIQMLMQFAGKA